jgi:hypothetical protein
MRRLFPWIVVLILFVGFHALNYLNSPPEMVATLWMTADDFRSLAEAFHALFLIVLLAGLAIQRTRDFSFTIFLATISVSTAIISLRESVYTYACVFATIFILIVRAYVTGRLRFDLGRVKSPAIICGLCGLISGYWYLYWIDPPILRNALLYSPLGVVYGPTLLSIGGFLCFSTTPKSFLLEASVGFSLLLSGFWGFLMFRVWYDALLIVLGLFLFIRLGSRLDYTEVFESGI